MGGASDFDRRELLRRGAALGIGASLFPGVAGAEEAAAAVPAVRRRVVLGATGIEMPDISFGASRLDGDVALVHHALDRGITYFDSAYAYSRGESEKTLGRALEGRRDEVVLVSKTETTPTMRRDEIFARLEESLRRLRTDHVDLYFNHAVNDPEVMRNPEWAEFASRAKEQGKIRFTGMSGHGGRLAECLDVAIDEHPVDVLLVAFNFGQDPSFYERFTGSLDFIATQPRLPELLTKARKQGIGVVAMKTLRGAKLNDMRPYEGAGATFAQAAFRWVLSSELADGLIVTMKSPDQVDEYLGASGWTSLHPADAGLLRRYARLTDASQCRYGCDACSSACPSQVAIPEVLRTRMYAEDYEDVALARESYAAIASAADPCLGCASQACTSACPYPIPVAELTQRAHRLLS